MDAEMLVPVDEYDEMTGLLLDIKSREQIVQICKCFKTHAANLALVSSAPSQSYFSVQAWYYVGDVRS